MSIRYLVLFTTPTGKSTWHEHDADEELQIGAKISIDGVDGACEVLNAWKDLDDQMLAFTVQFKPEFG